MMKQPKVISLESLLKKQYPGFEIVPSSIKRVENLDSGPTRIFRIQPIDGIGPTRVVQLKGSSETNDLTIEIISG